MRTIILDGYNVILRSPAFRPDERRDLATAREKLENLLSGAVGGAGDAEFLLVFDGADVPGAPRRRPGRSPRVDVRFSTPPEKADDLIRTLVEDWSETRENITVVTSDLEIARHARAHGATIVFSDLFAASLFKERVEERLKDVTRPTRATRATRATRPNRATRAAPPTGSPTAEGSDAETKPDAVSRRERDEWMRLFDEQRDEDP